MSQPIWANAPSGSWRPTATAVRGSGDRLRENILLEERSGPPAWGRRKREPQMASRRRATFAMRRALHPAH
eukprot:7295967-Pyramimonas_sp.AAC.1